MTDTPTDRETVERLEQVPHWDGDACACAWCGESEAAVCIGGEPVCATCHTIAYERALIRDRRALRARAEAAEAACDAANNALLAEVTDLDLWRKRAEAAEAEVERLQKARGILRLCQRSALEIHDKAGRHVSINAYQWEALCAALKDGGE